MSEVFLKIRTAIEKVFPYPFHFQCDPEAEDIHYVRMYMVPDDFVMSVKKELRRLIVENLGDSDDMIIPSICSLSDTKEYYREYLPRDPEPVDFQFVQPWNMMESYKETDCPCRREIFAFAA